MDDVIGQLLREGLLPALGDDPERAGWIRQASKDLRGQFLSDRRPVIVSGWLAAVDDGATSDASALQAAREAVTAHWETFANAFPQQDPVTLLRAVTLDALVAAAGQDDRVRAASWYTLRNVDVAVAGRWAGVVSDFRDGISARVEADVARMWSPSPTTSKLTMPAVSTDGVDAGSSDVDGLDDFRTAFQPYSGGNNPPQVAQIVGQHMPAILEGLAETVTEAVAAASTAHKDELRTYGTELGKKLRETLNEYQRSIEAIERRSTLLWWRMSGRSNALDCRYSDAGSAAVAALAAAVDVHHLIGQPAPRSVEHMIADMIEDSGFADKQVTVEDLAEAGAQFGQEIAASADSTPRPLVAAVSGCEPARIAASLSAPATAAERAVTLFRELQADELLRKSES